MRKLLTFLVETHEITPSYRPRRAASITFFGRAARIA
jgi:hypothetical protein